MSKLEIRSTSGSDVPVRCALAPMSRRPRYHRGPKATVSPLATSAA